jgi:uncharacterized protein (TIGR03086 family)
MIEWMPSFLDRAGIDLAFDPSACSIDDDAAAAWDALTAAIQALLDNPHTASREFEMEPVGRHRVDDAIDMFMLGDIVVHTWDLARATGLDETLDPERVHEMLVGMEPIDEMLRGSGHYGPKVAVADDADEQTRLIAFTGRTP